MKTGTLVPLSLLGLAAAQPQHGHRHADLHNKRAIVTKYETIQATAPAAVVYVDEQGNVLYTSTTTPAVQSVAVAAETPVVAAAGAGGAATPQVFTVPSIEVPAPQQTTLQTTYKTPSPPAASTSTTSEPSSAPSAGSNGYGITYSPYNADGTCKTQAEVDADFEHIADYSIVRSYGVDCNQVTTIMSAAKAKGIKVFLGIYNVQPASQVAADVQTLVKAVGSDWSQVHSVSVGNEDVNAGKADVATVVSATNSARSQLRAAGFSGPVVHVDTFNAIIANPQLCEASDYAAANCHAFFSAGTAAAGAGAYVALQAKLVKEACGGKETYITESGWPHQGEANGAAVPSRQNQQAALASLKSSFSDNIFLFSAFDDMWKKNNAGTFGAEQYWGFLS